jgi:hypothetical protein
VRIKVNYIAPLLAAGAAAVAITAAPIAAAAAAVPTHVAAHGACDAGVSGSICDSPGTVGINNSPPPVSYDPYGGEAFLLGYGRDFHNGGVHGGFHGGGGGGHR